MTRYELLRGVCAVLYSPVRTARIMADHRMCAYRLNEARREADTVRHSHDFLSVQVEALKRHGRDREDFISAISSLYEQHLEDS